MTQELHSLQTQKTTHRNFKNSLTGKISQKKLTSKVGVIGIAGVARSGKDTACRLLTKYFKKYGIEAKRVAFADVLKKECSAALAENFGINVFDPSDEEKNAIRPILVGWGKARRLQTQGRYFIDMINEEVESCLRENIIPIITDVRYADYDYDELDWVLENGILIHVSRIATVKGARGVGVQYTVEADVPPANEDEERNDPILMQNANYHIHWETFDSEDFHYPQLEHIVDEYVKQRTE